MHTKQGTEYSFASGGGIFESTPKEAAGAQFRVSIELGAFDGGQFELNKALSELRDDFGPNDYNLIRKNCNHFANALSWRLLNRQIPGCVNRLADIGVCCSCFLPRSMIEHAPVGDPSGAGFSSGGGGGRTYSASKKQTAPAVFTGSGAKLGGSSSGGGGGGGLLSSLRSGSTARQDDLTDRREKARMAALARMERGNTASTSESDTDKSR